MKIISGKLKGRTIATNNNVTYRPITSMLKEAIFSILSSGKFIKPGSGLSIVEDAVIMDLFGGSGNLSFEAISRGASKVVIIEKDQLHVDLLKRNAKRLSVEDSVVIIKGDATHLPTPKIKEECSIVFIDPPFNAQLVEPSVKSLVDKQWLADKSYLIIRTHNKEKYNIDYAFDLVFERNYSNSLLAIYQFHGQAKYLES